MDQRPCYAFFLSLIDNTIGNAMLNGALEKARKDDANVICMNGGELIDDSDSVIYNPQVKLMI